MNRVRIGVFFVLCAMLVGCRSAQQGPPSAVGKSTLPQFVVQWPLSLKLGDDKVAAVYVLNDLVVVHTDANRVHVVKADGSFVFSAQMADPRARVYPPVRLTDLLVFPTVSTLECYGLDGRRIKSVRLEAPARSAAVGERATVFVGIDEETGGRLAAIAPLAEGRTQQWSKMFGLGHIGVRPAMFQGQIFVGTNAGRVMGSSETGEPIWGTASENFMDRNAVVLGSPVSADLKADEGGVYVATMDAKVLCLSRNDGLIRWVYYTGAVVREAPVIIGGTIYLMVPGRGLVAMDKVTVAPRQDVRKPRWILDGVSQVLSEDSANTYVAIPRGRGMSIGAVDKTTGELRKETARKDFAAFGTNIKTGVIYAVTVKGQLVSISPSLKPVIEGVPVVE